MKGNNRYIWILAGLLLTVGCTEPGPDQVAVVKKASSVETGTPPGPPTKQNKVSRIVFLDLEDCCDCTRNRIDTSWNTLQAVLSGETGSPPVERIHMDSQSDGAVPY